MFGLSYSKDETISTLEELENLEEMDYDKILSIIFFGIGNFYEIPEQI